MLDDDTPRGLILTRRQVLGLLAGGMLAAGCGLTVGARQSAGVIVTPEETEGPFFVDERLKRSDLTTGTRNAAVLSGVPLVLRVKVARLDGGSVKALPGAQVDVWHADAHGVYSAVGAAEGETFLRGFQVSDAHGAVRFKSIYPGSYPGRTNHVHVKIRFSGREFTSQLYFDDAVSDAVHARAPYTARTMRNGRDGLYDRRLQVSLMRSRAGYEAAYTVVMA